MKRLRLRAVNREPEPDLQKLATAIVRLAERRATDAAEKAKSDQRGQHD